MGAREIRYFFVVFLTAVLITACSTNNSQSESNQAVINPSTQADPEQMDPNGRLNLLLSAEPTYLNPILSTDAASSSVEGYIFNGLLKVGKNLEMVPDLAKSFTVSPDGLTYTFYLRDDVTWHDGHPFTADDVIFTFEKLLDPKTNTVRRSNYVINGTPLTFKKQSDYRVTVSLPEPFSPFLVRMGMSIIPKHIFESVDINTTSFNQNPIGTGPFKFEKWESARYVHLSRNDEYFLGKPKLKDIYMNIIPDDNTALISLEKGEIDMGGVPYKEIKRLLNEDELRIYKFPRLMYTYMGFNLKHDAFSDLRIRKAIAHAIQKESIVRGVLKGYGSPAYLPSAPVSWAYPDDESSLDFATYDPAKARQLIEAAGYTLNEKTKVYEKDGRPLAFTVLTNQGNKDRERSAEIIQQFLSHVGIKMSIQLMEWSSFIKILNAPDDPKKFDAAILGWSLGLDPDGSSIWHSSEYPSGFNFVAYQNERVDQLLVDGRREIAREKRKEIYSKMYQEIARDLPYIFLYYPDSVIGVNKRVGGLAEPGPLGLMPDIHNVFVTKGQ